MLVNSVAISLLLAAYGCHLLFLAGTGWAQPIGLKFCPATNFSNSADINPSLNDSVKRPVQDALGSDVAKACLDQLEQLAREVNQFYVLEFNESAILDTEVCSQDETQLAQLIRSMNWEVALRATNRNQALFKYPIVRGDPDWMYRKTEISDTILWTPVNLLPNKDDLCLTRTGQLRFIQFKPELAGTYAVRRQSGVTYPTGRLEKRVLDSLWAIFFHVDFVYDSLEFFERVPVRQRLPPLSPKVTPARMFSSEPNLRYQYRSSPEPPKAVPMPALVPNSTNNGARAKFNFPPNLFKNLTISMMWSPPKELHEFSSWSPACGTKITRVRFMRCAVDIDITQLDKRLSEFVHSLDLETEYNADARRIDYKAGDGLSMLHLLHTLVARLKYQLLDEAREASGRRPLFSAGLHWTQRTTDRVGAVVLQKLRIPCHYSLLHHLPNKTVKNEGRASLEVFKIENTGEREQGVRLCGLADPLELLRMMGQVLVAQLKRLVNMIRRRPVVPQRSVVATGKTLYMKCPVDLLAFERPACNLPDRDDNILWTLNGKSMRFFSADVERGPSLTDECALTVKNIQINDAGEYVCYRTRMGSNSIEDKPAYRHFVEVLRPEFDPPPVEEVYFGMTVCIAWNGFMLLLWSLIAIVRSFLSLLGKEPDGPGQPEVWTSFFDDDPALDDRDDEDDEEESSLESEDDDESLADLDMSDTFEQSDEDEGEGKGEGEGEGEGWGEVEDEGWGEGEGEGWGEGEGEVGGLPSNKSKSVNRERHNTYLYRWRRARTWMKKKKD